jgi:hypothetical protein
MQVRVLLLSPAPTHQTPVILYKPVAQDGRTCRNRGDVSLLFVLYGCFHDLHIISNSKNYASVSVAKKQLDGVSAHNYNYAMD